MAQTNDTWLSELVALAFKEYDEDILAQRHEEALDAVWKKVRLELTQATEQFNALVGCQFLSDTPYDSTSEQTAYVRLAAKFNKGIENVRAEVDRLNFAIRVVPDDSTREYANKTFYVQLNSKRETELLCDGAVTEPSEIARAMFRAVLE